jgi:transcriptional regulator with XRE-family HTH domain
MSQTRRAHLRIVPAPEDLPGSPTAAKRLPGSRRPHDDARVAMVRELIEHSALTYSEISAETGVGRASISRWTRDGFWIRPPDAPVCTDRLPTARASQKMKMRKLAERLRLLAERYTRKLEASEDVDIATLVQALEVLKMARLEAQGRRRRRPRGGFTVGPTRTGYQMMEREEALHAALKEMRRGGVRLEHVPQEAMDLLVSARTPLEDNPALLPRGKRR